MWLSIIWNRRQWHTVLPGRRPSTHPGAQRCGRISATGFASWRAATFVANEHPTKTMRAKRGGGAWMGARTLSEPLGLTFRPQCLPALTRGWGDGFCCTAWLRHLSDPGAFGSLWLLSGLKLT